MAIYEINGGKPLSGNVTISGAKNAAVAILPAALLVSGKCRIENVPNISDVRILLDILEGMGADIQCPEPHVVEIDCTAVHCTEPNADLVREMRASYYLMGALLGRFGKAHVALPGGCNFASRPIDQHIKGFLALGADVDETEEYVSLTPGPNGLQGSRFSLDLASVGATANIIIAATLLPGQTIIENAAKEPHIVDLANFLNAMGARISGAGTDVIKVRGVKQLRGGSYSIIPDQIEAGTYMAAVAAAGGSVTIRGVIPKHLDCITAKLREMGMVIREEDDAVCLEKTRRLKRANVKTMPYPGFPTDMQPQIAVCMSTANGTSIVTEGIYDNRFRYTAELNRMGAHVQVEGKAAVIDGVRELHGCEVRACDLRAGAAMVIAALSAKGVSIIEDAQYIERGYEDIIGKLTALGASIRRTETFDSLPAVAGVG